MNGLTDSQGVVSCWNQELALSNCSS